MRLQRFFSLNEHNRALRTLLADLNQRLFKKLPGSRASAFAEMDRPACARCRNTAMNTPNGQWRGAPSLLRARNPPTRATMRSTSFKRGAGGHVLHAPAILPLAIRLSGAAHVGLSTSKSDTVWDVKIVGNQKYFARAYKGTANKLNVNGNSGTQVRAAGFVYNEVGTPTSVATPQST